MGETLILLAIVVAVWMVFSSARTQKTTPPDGLSPGHLGSAAMPAPPATPPPAPPEKGKGQPLGPRVVDEELRKQLPPGAALAD